MSTGHLRGGGGVLSFEHKCGSFGAKIKKNNANQEHEKEIKWLCRCFLRTSKTHFSLSWSNSECFQCFKRQIMCSSRKYLYSPNGRFSSFGCPPPPPPPPTHLEINFQFNFILSFKRFGFEDLLPFGIFHWGSMDISWNHIPLPIYWPLIWLLSWKQKNAVLQHWYRPVLHRSWRVRILWKPEFFIRLYFHNYTYMYMLNDDDPLRIYKYLIISQCNSVAEE